MISEEFVIEELSLKYYVGISQVKIEVNTLELNNLFDLIQNLEHQYSNATIQFFNDRYVLNKDHIFSAIYFTQKAFFYNNNISNSKKIEFLLYLASKRQIKTAIELFGINNTSIKSGELNFCIISPINDVIEIYGKIKEKLGFRDLNFELNNQSIKKYNRIKNFYEFNDFQIEIVLDSYEISKNEKKSPHYEINSLYLALHDLICEKMSLLNLEKSKLNQIS